MHAPKHVGSRNLKQTNHTIDESIYNAFEPNISEAELADNVPQINNVTVICFVHNVMCKNVEEFERLAKQRYGF